MIKIAATALLSCFFWQNTAFSSCFSDDTVKEQPQQHRLKCRTGEIVTLSDSEITGVRQVQKDGSVVYIEDREGRLFSYEADAQNNLQRTEIFRLPVLKSFYRGPNYFQLENPSTECSSWALSRNVYPDNPEAITISVFEMVSNNPIQLRNRDPWLPPEKAYMHAGPKGMAGVHITALDTWVAIAGYNAAMEHVVAVRQLTYDHAGHNPFMRYQLEGQSEVTWKPNCIFQAIAERIGVSQNVIQLPLPNWQILPLPEDVQPNVTLQYARQENGGQRILLNFAKSSGERLFFDVMERCYVEEVSASALAHTLCWWPDFPEAVKFAPPRFATFNGVTGRIDVSSQEPFLGFFEGDDGIHRGVFAVRRGVLDFLGNDLRYFDTTGKEVDFKLLGPISEGP